MEVAGPGYLEGLVCRDSRAGPAAAAATGPSTGAFRLLGAGCRAIRLAKLSFKLSVDFTLFHGLGRLESMWRMALLT